MVMCILLPRFDQNVVSAIVKEKVCQDILPGSLEHITVLLCEDGRNPIKRQNERMSERSYFSDMFHKKLDRPDCNVRFST